MLRIRELRKANGITMKELGKIVGASEVSISTYERGLVEPDIETLCKMADYFHVSVDSLLGRSKNKYEDERPKTYEANLLVRGVDKLSQAEREQALNVVRAMFSQYSDYFKEREKDAP